MEEDPLARFREASARREAAGLRRRLRPRPPGDPGELDLAGNDYLGLSRHPTVVDAAAAAARDFGTGATGSRLVTGTTELHARLERELADFTGAPAALVHSSGYLANLAAVTALCGADCLVVSDTANHASLIAACRLSRGQVVVVGHRDVEAVEAALAARTVPHALVVSDAVFSVDGDLAPVARLLVAARRHGALLLLDEAHALGVVGAGGRGAAHAAGVARAPELVRTVTLSKALAAQGGAVLAAPEIIDTLIDTASAFIFDTALAPPSAGAALAALRLLRQRPRLASRAREVTAALAAAAAEVGLRPSRPDAAVCAITLGDPHRALAAQALCAEHGVRVGCFRPPSVPPGGSCLRLTGRADLTAEQLRQVSVALRAVAATQGSGR